MTSIRELQRLVPRAVRNLDPRIVRFRDPGPRVRLWIGIAVVSSALVAGAAALAATGRGDPGEATKTAAHRALPPEPEHAPNSRNADGPTNKARPLADHHPNFHDPIYVFTEGPVADVSAYPMADPPGVVVNLDGAPEPNAAPGSMVGEDSRIRAIRRRVTDQGLRYVVGLTIPVKRIEVLHEGNVVIVTPIK